MEAVARAKFSRGSARKVRRVADLIRGKNVEEALNILSFVPKYAAQYLEKTLKSATANAISLEGTAKLKAEDLHIKKIFVDGGPIMKRIRPSSMGRAYRVRKRTNHLTIVVSDEIAEKGKVRVKAGGRGEEKEKEKKKDIKREKKKDIKKNTKPKSKDKRATKKRTSDENQG
jgi:large subunit ribosomal protein L22